jgi:hypothetical protein
MRIRTIRRERVEVLNEDHIVEEGGDNDDSSLPTNSLALTEVVQMTSTIT